MRLKHMISDVKESSDEDYANSTVHIDSEIEFVHDYNTGKSFGNVFDSIEFQKIFKKELALAVQRSLREYGNSGNLIPYGTVYDEFETKQLKLSSAEHIH